MDALLAEAPAISRNERKTLFTVLLAAWNVLLHRYTGQEDLVTGSVIAGRTHAQLENLIGFFVNTVALRTRPVPDQTFPAYLGAVESTVLAAQEHQDVPFDRVVAELRLERDPSRSPIFQVMFILHNTPRMWIAQRNRHRRGRDQQRRREIRPDARGDAPGQRPAPRNRVQHRPLYPRDRRAPPRELPDAVGGYRGGSKPAAGRPEIVHPRERARVRDVWNATAAPLDRAQTIISCFEARVVAHPGAMAVADERKPDLRRTRCAGEPARARPHRTGRRPAIQCRFIQPHASRGRRSSAS